MGEEGIHEEFIALLAERVVDLAVEKIRARDRDDLFEKKGAGDRQEDEIVDVWDIDIDRLILSGQDDRLFLVNDSGIPEGVSGKMIKQTLESHRNIIDDLEMELAAGRERIAEL